jgi:putative ABC transport system permease protein
MNTLLQDLRYALRALFRSPGFTAVAILTLALGIGVNTAAFSIVDGVLLRPLAYPDSERLVAVWASRSDSPYNLPISYPDFTDLRAETRSFEGVALARGHNMTLRGTEGAEALIGALVTDDFFRALGVRTHLGRAFLPEEMLPGAPRTVVLRYAFWQTRFGGDPAIIGRTLDFTDGSYTVVGVMPRGATYPEYADVIAPLAAVATGEDLSRRDHRVDNWVIGRLGPGATVEGARAQLAGIAKRLEAAYPEDNDGWSLTAVPLREIIVGDIRPLLLTIMGAVAFVLLIACANVANLFLVRATGREREIAVRTALGASRWRVARQLLTESALLAVLGGGLGLLLGGWGVELLSALDSGTLPRVAEVAMDARVLGFTAILVVFTTLLFGLAPAIQSTVAGAIGVLRESGRGGSASGRAKRFRNSLVVAEVALAVVLLIGAGLLLRSFQQLRNVELGFQPERLVFLRVMPPMPEYEDPARLTLLYDRILEAARSLSGAESVAFTNHLPANVSGLPARVTVEGRPAEDAQRAWFRTSAAGYFEAMGIQLLHGRTFTEADISGHARVAVVSRALADQYWPGEDPVGRRLTVFNPAVGRSDYGEPIDVEVIGVIGKVRHMLLADGAIPEIHLPYTLVPWPSAYLAVRAERDPASLIPSLRQAIMTVDRDIPVAGMETMNHRLGDLLAQRRLAMLVLISFAATALTLALIGIYGIMAYAVAQRTKEIGIRMAVGADATVIRRMVLRQGTVLILSGIALGSVAAIGVTRLLASQLYGITPTDPATFAGVALIFAAVAFLASYIPARRATRVDPIVVLRSE